MNANVLNPSALVSLFDVFLVFHQSVIDFTSSLTLVSTNHIKGVLSEEADSTGDSDQDRQALILQRRYDTFAKIVLSAFPWVN